MINIKIVPYEAPKYRWCYNVRWDSKSKKVVITKHQILSYQEGRKINGETSMYSAEVVKNPNCSGTFATIYGNLFRDEDGLIKKETILDFFPREEEINILSNNDDFPECLDKEYIKSLNEDCSDVERRWKIIKLEQEIKWAKIRLQDVVANVDMED